ncbi:hypothetical protein D3C79_290890 [compost metagenome]
MHLVDQLGHLCERGDGLAAAVSCRHGGERQRCSAGNGGSQQGLPLIGQDAVIDGGRLGDGGNGCPRLGLDAVQVLAHISVRSG